MIVYDAVAIRLMWQVFLKQDFHRDLLVSYYLATCVDGEEWDFLSVPNKFNTFMDSGAHSANTLGKVIDLDDYMEFLLKNKLKIGAYAGLDVIGSHEKSMENQKIMEESGFNPLPTFHYGEPFDVLHQMAEAYPYFCLGGVVGKRRAQKVEWLDNCWGVIKNHFPVKVHMFGVFDDWILQRYPFYSCDASSNSRKASFGYYKADGKSCKQHKNMTSKDGILGMNAILSANNNTETLTQRAQLRYINLVKETPKKAKFLTQLWTARGVVWDD